MEGGWRRRIYGKVSSAVAVRRQRKEMMETALVASLYGGEGEEGVVDSSCLAITTQAAACPAEKQREGTGGHRRQAPAWHKLAEHCSSFETSSSSFIFS